MVTKIEQWNHLSQRHDHTRQISPMPSLGLSLEIEMFRSNMDQILMNNWIKSLLYYMKWIHEISRFRHCNDMEISLQGNIPLFYEFSFSLVFDPNHNPKCFKLYDRTYVNSLPLLFITLVWKSCFSSETSWTATVT